MDVVILIFPSFVITDIFEFSFIGVTKTLLSALYVENKYKAHPLYG